MKHQDSQDVLITITIIIIFILLLSKYVINIFFLNRYVFLYPYRGSTFEIHLDLCRNFLQGLVLDVIKSKHSNLV